MPSLTLSRGKFEAVGTKAQAEINALKMQAQSAMYNTLRVIAWCVVCAVVGFILMYLMKNLFWGCFSKSEWLHCQHSNALGL
jgi:hypothetical protein